jgi:MFS family permease
VIHQPDLKTAIALIRAVPFGASAWKFWMVIVMVFINWGIEAGKWQLLMSNVERLGFFTAFRSVLCGVTMSIHTPNRIGEYAGRVLFIKEGNRLKAVSLSIVGGMAQLIITMLMGCLGLTYLLLYRDTSCAIAGLSDFWLALFLYGSVFGMLVFLLFFFRLGWLVRLTEKLPGAKKFVKYINVLEEFDVKILLRLLVLSFLRYIVFVIQYIFMLQLLQVEPLWWPGFWLITVLFWIMAIIPSFAIAELGIRGTVAKTLFACSQNTIGILAVTFGIWFVNLFVPALIGSLLILGIKIKKEK